jgi:poly-beta-1,6-N-acetyl-D-glucosamine N-deacetylase
MRDILFRLLLPLSFIFEWLWSDRFRVLAYHDVKDALLFEKQILFLKRKYVIMSLDELKTYCKLGKPLPRKAMLITFDDGDITVYEKGLKILTKHEVASALFIITELIGSQKPFWWKRIEHHYNAKGDSYADARQTVRRLKSVSNRERLSTLSSFTDTEAIQLSRPQLETLVQNGVAIANHSHTHPMFDRCTSEELQMEMNNSRTFFDSFGSGHFDVFAYPNGNYDARSEDILKRAGVRFAFLFDHRLNNQAFDPMRISRIRVNADHDLAEFRVRVSGLHRLLARVI